MLPERYDPILVVLSYLVAFLGSYTALSIAARLTAPSGRLRLRWLLGGAFAEGTAIWSMHFTGMLALHLPVAVAYNVTLATSSLLIASTGSLLALWLTQRPALGRVALVAGGLAIGAGIVGLHYMDMAAMRMPARTRYSALLVVASIVVAVVFGLVSLSLGRRYRREDPRRSPIGQWIAAGIMGVAIVGQHYTGMAAVTFYAGPEPAHLFTGLALPAQALPQAVLLSTLLILATALGSVAVDRRSSARARLASRLLGAQESERRRIARVLHDDVGQLLTAIRLNLQRLAVSTGPDRALVADSVAMVDEALGRVRALSLELRPSVLDDLGLGDAVAWFANRQAERAGYEVVVEQGLGEDRLPEEVETAGFRIVQQALTNVARHARARNVQIVLRRDPGAVELTVADDGSGFDVRDARMRSQAGESLGLLDMTELAKMAGGSLTIASTEGTGTTVRVRFPLSVV
jgi:NO-binding membrane sensor protein with MHYT domain/anti-sigma regulatory factor (Ser/Thr protein kinase)